jgi:phage FluMu protein Com
MDMTNGNPKGIKVRCPTPGCQRFLFEIASDRAWARIKCPRCKRFVEMALEADGFKLETTKAVPAAP